MRGSVGRMAEPGDHDRSVQPAGGSAAPRHIVVVGAGIVGAAVAHTLLAAGVDVTVVEAAAPGQGTSGTSLAWVNSNQKPPRSYHDFSVRGMRAWQRLADEFGQPSWYVPAGNLAWACDDRQRADLAAVLARLRDWGYPVEEVGTREMSTMEPRVRVPAGAYVLHFPAQGFVYPRAAVDALLAGARVVSGRGAAVLESRGSRVTAVRLGDGERIVADAYVCCAGWRTPALLEPLGVQVPLVPGDVPGSAAPGLVARVATANPLLGRVVHAPDLSLRPDSPVGLRMDAEDVNGRVHTHTAPADLDRYARELVERASRIVAGVPSEPVVEARLCVRPLPVDGKPIVGWLPAVDNVYLIVGHSGVTLAPLLARLGTGEIVSGRADAALDEYRITRFD
jgi:glycine/D-amino acid oxidase-like deaminating enzyme